MDLLMSPRLKILELQESAQRKEHFGLFHCLVIGHTKYKGVQRVYCNPFPAKPFHGSHRLDLVMIRQQGIDNGAFVVHGDSSPTWHPRLGACALVLPHQVCTLPHQVSCYNVYKVNNGNNRVIIVHNVKQSVLYLSGKPLQKIFYCMISAIIHFLFCM